MEGGLLLDVVVGEGSAVLELFTSEDESLLIGRDTFLVLNFSFHVLNGVRGLDVKSNSLAGKGLDEDLHSSSESQDEMEGGLLLDIVVGESSAVLELLSSEDKSLLIWRDTFLVLDLCLDVLDGVRRLDVKGDCFTCEGFDEYLHYTF